MFEEALNRISFQIDEISNLRTGYSSFTRILRLLENAIKQRIKVLVANLRNGKVEGCMCSRPSFFLRITFEKLKTNVNFAAFKTQKNTMNLTTGSRSRLGIVV